MRPIEFNGVIGRTQMQHAEDGRTVAEQQTMTRIGNKAIETKSNQVNSNENAEMNTGYDAEKEGKGHYEQQENRNKKNKEDGIVVVKKKAGFDVKI